MQERQELHCHACNRYVQFTLDLSLNGQHVLHCPNCGHEHCRVVRNGVITDTRWDQRNGPTIYIAPYATASTAVSTYNTTASTSGGCIFLYNSWMQTTAGS